MASHTPTPKTPVITHEQHNGDHATQRAQWLRAAILGANDGLLSTTSLMLGVSSAQDDKWSIILSGIAGAIAGSFSMAVGEFVSVSTQRDIEKAVKCVKPPAILLSDNRLPLPSPGRSPAIRAMATASDETMGTLPSPVKAAVASGLAFIAGSLAPLVTGTLVSSHSARVSALVIVSSITLAMFGGLGAHLGKSSVRDSAVRVLVGGWIAMAVTYWLLKPLHKKDGDD
ncbi:hypothetical protein J5N97_026137 [Dioscorea zingiberensis]|uniref:Vacuolar iron transporter n=1 Tax=Dioscorea zingiberensis TaxID=325984 RepID=A0A9D5H685_9LILI|nr:hypothetical protein J5N97_026137 [Dioscorea zingiberensis]